MADIIIEFDENGESSIEGKGFPGKTCDKEMEPFEKALGVLKKRKNKPEYFQTQTQKTKVTY